MTASHQWHDTPEDGVDDGERKLALSQVLSKAFIECVLRGDEVRSISTSDDITSHHIT